MVCAAMVSRTPFASTRPICWPVRVNATGFRSTIAMRIRSGSSRITVARSIQGICSSCLRLSLKGTKKMLRPMSSPKTGSIWARVTSVSPVV